MWYVQVKLVGRAQSELFLYGITCGQGGDKVYQIDISVRKHCLQQRCEGRDYPTYYNGLDP